MMAKHPPFRAKNMKDLYNKFDMKFNGFGEGTTNLKSRLEGAKAGHERFLKEV